MGTRAILARRQGEDWKGVWVSLDGYPSGLGSHLCDRLAELGGDVAAVARELIDEAPFGWIHVPTGQRREAHPDEEPFWNRAAAEAFRDFHLLYVLDIEGRSLSLLDAADLDTVLQKINLDEASWFEPTPWDPPPHPEPKAGWDGEPAAARAARLAFTEGLQKTLGLVDIGRARGAARAHVASRLVDSLGREGQVGELTLLGPNQTAKIELPGGSLAYDLAEAVGDDLSFVDGDWLDASDLLHFDIEEPVDADRWRSAGREGLLAAAKTALPDADLDLHCDEQGRFELFRFFKVTRFSDGPAKMSLKKARDLDPDAEVGADMGVKLFNRDLDLVTPWLGWLRGDP